MEEAASDSKDGGVWRGGGQRGVGREPTACSWDREALGALDLCPVAGGEEGGLECPHRSALSISPRWRPGKEEFVATFKGNEFFCYDLSHNPIQSSTDEITLAFRTLQRNGLMLHTGKSADYVNLSLKSGAVWLVINLGSGAFEALVEPVNGKFNDNAWHDVRVTRNLRQVGGAGRWPGASGVWGRMGVGSEATGMWGQASGRVAGCGSEGCLGFGSADRGQECAHSGQAARTRIHAREEAAELSRARAWGKRKGWARAGAGDWGFKGWG